MNFIVAFYTYISYFLLIAPLTLFTAFTKIHVPLYVKINKMFPDIGIDKEIILMEQEIITRIDQ